MTELKGSFVVVNLGITWYRKANLLPHKIGRKMSFDSITTDGFKMATADYIGLL